MIPPLEKGREEKTTSSANSAACARSEHAGDAQRKSEFTPGPWRVFNSDYGCRPGIEGAHTSVVAYGTAADAEGVLGETAEERAANARLIAAAPDLYEALRSGVWALETAVRAAIADADFAPSKVEEILREHLTLKAMRAALAKSEGR